MATYYFQASCCGQQSCGVCVAIWLASSGFTPQDCDNSLQSFTDLRQCYYVAVGYLSSARPDAMTEQSTHVLPGFSHLDKQFRLSKAFYRHQSAHFAGLGMGLCARVSWVISLTPLCWNDVWGLWVWSDEILLPSCVVEEQNNCENKPLLETKITFIKDFILQWITIKCHLGWITLLLSLFVAFQSILKKIGPHFVQMDVTSHICHCFRPQLSSWEF